MRNNKPKKKEGVSQKDTQACLRNLLILNLWDVHGCKFLLFGASLWCCIYMQYIALTIVYPHMKWNKCTE